MRVVVFDTHNFDKAALTEANHSSLHDLTFLETRLTHKTAILASGFEAVCSFVNDCIDADTLSVLKNGGTRLIALRSAGFNHVDLKAAQSCGIKVVRVPEYSPFAVAEHTVALILALSRKIHRSYNRIKELNFSLDGLVGFDLHGKTVGIIGTGRIGATFAKIMNGFGCQVLAFDTNQNISLSKELNFSYVPLDELLAKSHIVSLHLPLNPSTRHIIDKRAFSLMRTDSILINTGRGALVETTSLIDALKHQRIAGAGLDVYEEEEGIFFQDLSESGLQDDVLARLITFPNVIITSHQAFLTKEALKKIAETTLHSLTCFEKGLPLENEVKT
jgi:D-lactate dehydrogenase